MNIRVEESEETRKEKRNVYSKDNMSKIHGWKKEKCITGRIASNTWVEKEGRKENKYILGWGHRIEIAI